MTIYDYGIMANSREIIRDLMMDMRDKMTRKLYEKPK